jgi:hypothetical protein
MNQHVKIDQTIYNEPADILGEHFLNACQCALPLELLDTKLSLNLRRNNGAFKHLHIRIMTEGIAMRNECSSCIHGPTGYS